MISDLGFTNYPSPRARKEWGVGCQTLSLHADAGARYGVDLCFQVTEVSVLLTLSASRAGMDDEAADVLQRSGGLGGKFFHVGDLLGDSTESLALSVKHEC